VLASLRILARNCTYDCCQESTFVSAPRIRAFFYKFVTWFSETIFPEYVKMPTVDEIKRNGAEYIVAGIPGTIGSVDCVHVRLWNIAANLKQFATGYYTCLHLKIYC
jgi:hypothetical protein